MSFRQIRCIAAALSLTVAVCFAQSGPIILPQLAFGGGWYTALYFTNETEAPISFSVNFVAPNGSPLNVPGMGGTSATVNLTAHGTAVLEAPNSGGLNTGYVSTTLPDGVVGYGVFRQSVDGRPDQEAVVPFSSASSTTASLIWDDTNFTTTVGIVNPSPVATTVTITVRDTTGQVIGTAAQPLGPKNKVDLALKDTAGLGAVAGKRGSAGFTVTAGNLAVLGLRFGGSAFTSIPANGSSSGVSSGGSALVSLSAPMTFFPSAYDSGPLTMMLTSDSGTSTFTATFAQGLKMINGIASNNGRTFTFSQIDPASFLTVPGYNLSSLSDGSLSFTITPGSGGQSSGSIFGSFSVMGADASNYYYGAYTFAGPISGTYTAVVH